MGRTGNFKRLTDLFSTSSKRNYRWYFPEKARYPTWSYALMTIGGSVAAYGIAMIIDIEREKSRNLRWKFSSSFPRHEIKQSSNWELPKWWSTRRESERTILALIGCNVAVFVAWKVPALQSFLNKFFMHSTRSHPITLLTSTFSHVTGMHLLVNMIALYSFGRLLHEKMGREQFLAFYLTSGLIASSGSHIVKSMRGEYVKSLGASGAVFATAAACAHQPDLRVSLIFLPFISVPINLALPAMMIYDTVGLLKRWSTFDHAAHLSGAIFGYVFYSASTRHLWPKRHKILKSLGYPIK